MRVLFVLLVLVLLIGCSENDAIEPPEDDLVGEAGGVDDTGIDDVFGDGTDIPVPPVPS